MKFINTTKAIILSTLFTSNIFAYEFISDADNVTVTDDTFISGTVTGTITNDTTYSVLLESSASIGSIVSTAGGGITIKEGAKVSSITNTNGTIYVDGDGTGSITTTSGNIHLYGTGSVSSINSTSANLLISGDITDSIISHNDIIEITYNSNVASLITTGSEITITESATIDDIINNSGTVTFDQGYYITKVNVSKGNVYITSSNSDYDYTYVKNLNLAVTSAEDFSTVSLVNDGTKLEFENISITLSEDFDFYGQSLLIIIDENENGSNSIAYTNFVVTQGDTTLQLDSDYELITSDSGLTISFFGVSVPEPSTYAMIFGAMALGLAIYRKRK